MWYEKSMRRLTCDMHIEDWNDDFFKSFSPQKYHEVLKKTKFQSVLIPFQSHVGYSYYPAKTGRMHRALEGRETLIRDLVDLCRKDDIKVVGYYSIVYNTWVHDEFPSYRMIQADGKSRRESNIKATLKCSDAKIQRYGLCCPNNPDYRQFVLSELDEIDDFFEYDGMFFDMPFWPHMCYCDHCKKRWAKEVGGEIPDEGDLISNPRRRLHLRKRSEWMGEFVREIAQHVKSKHPDMPVEYNLASAVVDDWNRCCEEPVNDASDYVGGDLYGGTLEQSFACKLYRNITKNQPFEYMFSRCTPNLSTHTVTKSADQMKKAVMLTSAHHGATLVIDAIDPVGTFDERVYDRVGKVFEQTMPYEKYFCGEQIEDVGVYYSLRSKYFCHDNTFSNRNCAINTVKTMIAAHIPAGVTGGFHSLNKYSTIIASYLTPDDEYDNDRLAEYVENGGTLYLSGGDNTDLIKKLLGAEVEDYTGGQMVYCSPCGADDTFGWYNAKYPLPFTARTPLLTNIGNCRVIATITLPYTGETDEKYASIHSNPPGIATDYPAIIEKHYGKGRVIWSAVPLENNLNYEYQQIFLKILDLPRPTVTCDADENTELISFKDNNRILVTAVDLSEQYNIAPNRGFNVMIKCISTPKEVCCLPERTPVRFCYKDGYAVFHTGEYHVAAMFEMTL